MARRFEELDSLRGLAALSVVIHHFLIILPAFFDKAAELRLFIYSPLHVFWAGHEAVIFFFVLSGFVLCLPFLRGKPMGYSSFLAKRVCRIYIPYLAAIGVGLLAVGLVNRGEIPGLSGWVNRIWIVPFDAHVIMSHVLLIGRVNNDAIDPVIWSLVHEMRVSLVFPLLMLPVVRFGWRANLLLAAVLAFSGFTVQHLVSKYAAHWNDYGMSLQYCSLFIIGALLAKNRDGLSARFQRLTKPTRCVLGLTALLLYTYPWWFMPGVKLLHLSIIDDAVIAGGVSIVIVFALASGVVSRSLTRKIPIYLGRISYSLYLYHAIILLVCLHLLYGKLPLWSLWAISLCATMIVSTLAFYVTEVPSISIGRFLSERIQSLGFARNKHGLSSALGEAKRS